MYEKSRTQDDIDTLPFEFSPESNAALINQVSIERGGRIQTPGTSMTVQYVCLMIGETISYAGNTLMRSA